MKSPLTTSLWKQLNNHRTPMKIKYSEINTDKLKGDPSDSELAKHNIYDR
ncbi:hypothetical protein SAMN05443549_102385 [Flavobacterium fluvii]|uniref:Uncharacterized protein n=1 Tax=Flavobacterium fluvii TaxID=468056 RepID=A0A1M5HUM6_9FLAO|nr:hypothetical protein SAMN05443549_102385 [Flavobacterium fluvii]